MEVIQKKIADLNPNTAPLRRALVEISQDGASYKAEVGDLPVSPDLSDGLEHEIPGKKVDGRQVYARRITGTTADGAGGGQGDIAYGVHSIIHWEDANVLYAGGLKFPPNGNGSYGWHVFNAPSTGVTLLWAYGPSVQNSPFTIELYYTKQ